MVGFWLKFVGLNLPWLVAPIFALPAALYELAYWYRVEGYQAALQRHGIVEAITLKPAHDTGLLPVWQNFRLLPASC